MKEVAQLRNLVAEALEATGQPRQNPDFDAANPNRYLRCNFPISISTMASQSEQDLFSMRIVCIDYYMAPPILDADFCYSSFHGQKVDEVPVIRIYGSTPSGQKTCMHVHRALPYLYVPCSDASIQSLEEGRTCSQLISHSLENALKLKTSLGSKKQHVHGCSLVRARRFYGCHLPEELFVKIYLYYPHEVSRAASLFLEGAVLNKYFQPYESHVPYLLQFLIDHNLYGMGLLHLSKVKFRHPIPDHCVSREACFRKQSIPGMVNLSCDLATHKADSSSQIPQGTSIWVSSTIPSIWMWPSPAFDLQTSGPKRESTCELEGDAIVDDIVNQQFKMYTSLSHRRSEVKMVESLVPIWEEEYHRTGKLEAVRSPDPRKPPPENVLKDFSYGLEWDNALVGLYEEAHSLLSSQACSFEGAEKFMQTIQSISDVGSLLPDKELANDGNSDGLASENLREGNKDGYSSLQGYSLEDDEQQCESLPKVNCSPLHHTNESVGRKVGGNDALGLLRWLASSQAMDDLCSDDNLVNESILSPFLPTTTIEKVLEKAHIDYEIESQQECQDILDSVDVVHDKLDTSTSELVIPQMDGSADKQFTTHIVKPSKLQKKKALWGALPFPNSQTMLEDSGYYDEAEYDSKCEDPEKNKTGRFCNYSSDSSDKCILAEGNVQFDCSIRELMRKKRGQRAEQSDDESHGSKKRLPMKEKSPGANFAYNDHKKYGHLPFVALSGASDREGEANSDNLEDINRNPIKMNESFNAKQQGAASAICSGPCECCFSRKKCAPSRPASTDDYSCNCVLPVVASLRNFDEVDNQLVSRAETASSENTARADTAFGAQHLEFSNNRNDALENQNYSEDVSVQNSYYGVKDCVEYKEMTLSKKPPMLDFINRNIRHTSSFSGSFFQDFMKNVDSFDAEGAPADSISLFFDKSCLEGNGYGHKSESNEETSNNSLGIPTHCLNDGSLLYLLTPACAPPSLNSVHQWILQQAPQKAPNVSTVVEESEEVRVVPLSPKYDETKIELPASSNDQMAPCSADGHLSGKFLSSATPVSSDSIVMETNTYPCKKVIVENQDKISHENEGKRLENWQEVSQISGPDIKSKITPLSQTGFRDPAAVGASQQLTLLSVEVVANSRGDLKPDPRHDAVNIIALAIQEDGCNSLEVHVLVRGSDEGKCDRNIDGLSGCKVEIFAEEKCLLDHFVKVIYVFDPDILVGWEIQGGSLGFLAERAAHLGVRLLKTISRTPAVGTKFPVYDSVNSEIRVGEKYVHEALVADSVILEDAIIGDEWGRTHASGLHVGGRIVLNLWRIMSSELKLNMYTIEAVCEAVLRRKVPLFPSKTLMAWFSSGHGGARFRCIRYAVERAKLNFEIINQLDLVNRTAELARVYGIDFFSVLSRGSQYRVESMYLRLAHTQNYLSISPGNQQVASQPAMECLPLVMEPESGYYVDPVIVLDFQSLYPSMIIAYNLCYCTCLGKVMPSKTNQLGVSTYTPDLQLLVDLKDEILLTPNGVMYVPHKVRKGILPCMLEEILSTRLMVKQAMKKLTSSQQILLRILNARQLALKLIANVTYGYTAAGFSGRMPCAELADSIVQCGRRTLETAISFVNSHSTWKTRVIYGDTDSMFVLLKGRTLEEAFRIGQEIASEITAMNPNPVTLKMEKVYYPCVLLTKKRYVGYSYETLDQVKPIFAAKGIETVRRDTCGAVAKTLEQSLRILFDSDSIFPVKEYLERQWSRILCGKISLQDFVFAKEVRLGTYRASSLPPAALVASKAMKVDPRAEPHYAERVPYVVVHGEPGARLIDMVVDPLDLLDVNSPYRLNDQYYIRKQIIPALQRVFGLLGADLNKWYLEMPRPVKPAIAKRHFNGINMGCTYELDDDKQWMSRKPFGTRSRIDYYYLSQHCVLCGELVQVSSYLCERCFRNGPVLATALVSKTSKLERDLQHLAAICLHCGGGGGIVDSGVKCTSLACSVFYERRKVQIEFQGLSGIAANAGLYPKCNVEWF